MSRFFLTLVIILLSGPAEADTIIWRGLGPEPDSLDVHQAQGLAAVNLLRDLREGLLTFDAEGELINGVAESWDIQDGGLRYRFELREDARWSDGEPVLANDFLRGFRAAVDPATAAVTAGLLAPIKNAETVLTGGLSPDDLGVAVLSERVLEITLSRITPWFPEILAHPVSYPVHARRGNVAELEVNGAYRLTEWTPNAIIRLEKNPHFHSAASVATRTVAYYPIEQPAAELARYRAGELHITETIPAGRHDWLQENYPDELRIFPYLGSFWLNINLRHQELGRSADLRRALALAIDRDILTRVVTGAGEQPAYSLVPPGMKGYEPATMPESQLEQDQRETLARELFARSGAGRPGTLRLQLRYNTSGVHRRMAVAVAAMWKQVLGVETELFNEEWKVFVNNRRLGIVTEVFRGGWIADYADPGSFLDLFRSNSEMNFTFLENEEYDALFQQAELAQGTERLGLLERSEALLIREMPAIPLYYYVSRHLVQPGVRGFVDNVRDVHLSRYLSLEQP
jgi:oligopeptide transport system substrate-binding protein